MVASDGRMAAAAGRSRCWPIVEIGAGLAGRAGGRLAGGLAGGASPAKRSPAGDAVVIMCGGPRVIGLVEETGCGRAGCEAARRDRSLAGRILSWSKGQVEDGVAERGPGGRRARSSRGSRAGSVGRWVGGRWVGGRWVGGAMGQAPGRSGEGGRGDRGRSPQPGLTTRPAEVVATTGRARKSRSAGRRWARKAGGTVVQPGHPQRRARPTSGPGLQDGCL